jgi:hypothetical protein
MSSSADGGRVNPPPSPAARTRELGSSTPSW